MGSVHLYRYNELVKSWINPETVYNEIRKHGMMFTQDILKDVYELNTYGARNLTALLISKNILRLISNQEYVKYPHVSLKKNIYVLTDEALASLGKKKKEENQEKRSPYEKIFYLVSREFVLLMKKYLDIQKGFKSKLTLQPVLVYTNNEIYYTNPEEGCRETYFPLVVSKDITKEMSNFTMEDWNKIIGYINEEFDVLFPQCKYIVVLNIQLYKDNEIFVSISLL